ncbi:hypothetical protein BJY00DRAFT_307189 [Aspergillus carlsbadensis]|nr:hypothetical protein BJY00DRAFT_307189 [Aspergillus carlsbadensis]
MKRRAPPSPLDLAISSLTSFTPNGAVRGVAPGYISKTNLDANSNLNTNAYVSSNTSSKVTNYTTVTDPNSTASAYATSNASINATNRNTATKAHVTSNPNASSDLNSNTSTDTSTQSNRPAPGIESERPYHETYSLKMARFWAARAQALKEPFIPTGDDVGEGTAAGDAQYSGSTAGEMAGGGAEIDWLTTSQLPLPTPSLSQTQFGQPANPPTLPNTGPITNDGIATILKACAPACPKARAWLQAHLTAKAASAAAAQAHHLRAKLREREGLRKQVLQRLRAKTLEALKGANASREEAREVLEMLPPRKAEVEVGVGEEGVDVDVALEEGFPGALGDLSVKNDEKEGDKGVEKKQFLRVVRAHAQLQKFMREIEEMKNGVGTLAGGGSEEESDGDEEGLDDEGGSGCQIDSDDSVDSVDSEETVDDVDDDIDGDEMDLVA